MKFLCANNGYQSAFALPKGIVGSLLYERLTITSTLILPRDPKATNKQVVGRINGRPGAFRWTILNKYLGASINSPKYVTIGKLLF